MPPEYIYIFSRLVESIASHWAGCSCFKMKNWVLLSIEHHVKATTTWRAQSCYGDDNFTLIRRQCVMCSPFLSNDSYSSSIMNFVRCLVRSYPIMCKQGRQPFIFHASQPSITACGWFIFKRFILHHLFYSACWTHLECSGDRSETLIRKFMLNRKMILNWVRIKISNNSIRWTSRPTCKDVFSNGMHQSIVLNCIR